MSRGEETRAAILDRALAKTSEMGLEALSIGTLAREMGMSKSGLFAHFSSKERLQVEILDTAADRFVTEVVAPALRAPRGEPRVRALFEGWMEWERSPDLPGGCPFVAVANELDDRPGEARDRLVGYQQDWIEALATAARIAVEEGHFVPGLDVRQFAYDFHSLMLSYHFFARLLRDPEAEKRTRSSFERLLADSRSA